MSQPSASATRSNRSKRALQTATQHPSPSAAASAESAHEAAEPAPEKARGRKTKGKAATGSAAAAAAAAAAKPAMRLHMDALSSVFALCSLEELLQLRQTCRDWNEAVKRTPVIKALRATAALGDEQLAAVVHATSQLNKSRLARKRLSDIVRNREEELRRHMTEDASAPLLALLRSARLLRRSDEFDCIYARMGVGGTAVIQIQLPPLVTSAAAAAAASSESAAASPLRLRLSWLLGCAPYDHATENEWSITGQTLAGGTEVERLFSLKDVEEPGFLTHTIPWENRSDDAEPLAQLLRERGILPGTPFQQSELLHSFICALFELAEEKDVLGVASYSLREACDEACGYGP